MRKIKKIVKNLFKKNVQEATPVRTTKLAHIGMERVISDNLLPNMFQLKDYNHFGIKAIYHVFDSDEFWLPDGTKTNENGANEYIRRIDPKFYRMKRDNFSIAYC